MTIYNWLTLFGVPALILTFYKVIANEFNKTKNDTDAVKKGLQALLRNEMITMYNKWTEKGYAPIYVRENYKNCYDNYHQLGANGVMTDLYDKFIALPTDKPSVEIQKD